VAGFFLYKVLVEFCEIARLHGDLPFVERCRGRRHNCAGISRRTVGMASGICAATLTTVLRWVRHAIQNAGLIPLRQSWSVLSGAGMPNAPHGNGSGGHVPCSTGPWPDPAPGPAVRHIGSESRLHKRIRPGCKGEWRAIHSCGYLGGDGLRCVGRQPARVGTARNDQPAKPWRTREKITTYKVEPYVVAADVYAVSPHVGRGGWTWYTGSAGWMYRLILESLLGLRRERDKLRFAPCLPRIGRPSRCITGTGKPSTIYRAPTGRRQRGERERRWH